MMTPSGAASAAAAVVAAAAEGTAPALAAGGWGGGYVCGEFAMRHMFWFALADWMFVEG